MDDLNRRIAEARGEIRYGCLYRDLDSDDPDRYCPQVHDYLSDKAATFDALESLRRQLKRVEIYEVADGTVCCACGYTAEDEDEIQTHGANETEAIWRALLAMAENSPLDGQKLTTEDE